MAQLIVRNLENEVRDKLRKLAQSHGRSMEEEVRDILRAAVVGGADTADRAGLGTLISQRFAECHLEGDAPIEEQRGGTARPAEFG